MNAIRQRLLPMLVGLYALSACSNSPTLSPTRSPEEVAGLVYVVKPGDVLSIIALQHGESYRNLARWNELTPPYVIYPGQHLRLTPPPLSKKSIDDHQPSLSSESVPVKKDSSAPEVMESTSKLHWQWPARGKMLRGFSARNQGLDIDGQTGDPVFAAADGKVVYSGTGIIGYGQLIIIKHDNIYLSAYAYNQQLLVKEGDHVTRGQQIAEMGTNQRHQVILHFEIRRNGKSVDPRPYLPQR